VILGIKIQFFEELDTLETGSPILFVHGTGTGTGEFRFWIRIPNSIMCGTGTGTI
jgi:hypothetical protein